MNGGGVYVTGTVSVSGTQISGNAASNDGGGLYADGVAISVSNATISGNTADASNTGSEMAAVCSSASALTGAAYWNDRVKQHGKR